MGTGNYGIDKHLKAGLTKKMIVNNLLREYRDMTPRQASIIVAKVAKYGPDKPIKEWSNE